MFWPLCDVVEKCPELRKADRLFALSCCPKILRKKIDYHILRPASTHIPEGQLCIDPDYWASCWDAAYDDKKEKNETKRNTTGNIPAIPDIKNENHQSEDQGNHMLVYDDDSDEDLVVRVGDIWPTISNITNDPCNIPSPWYSDPHLVNTATIRTPHYDQPPPRVRSSFNNCADIKPLKSTQLSPVDIRHLFLIPALWKGTHEEGNISGSPMMTPASNCSMVHQTKNHDTACNAPVTNFDAQSSTESYSNFTPQVPNLDGFSKSPQSMSIFNNNANISSPRKPRYGSSASRAQHLVNTCSSTEPERQINAMDIRHLLQIPALWKKHFRSVMEQMPMEMSAIQQNKKRSNTHANGRKTRNFARYDSPKQNISKNIDLDVNNN